jgi:CRISPR-associated protein Cas2
MWVVAMFGLPSVSKTDKTHYRRFNDFLLDDGFSLIQFSVYGRHCATREKAEAHVQRNKTNIPERGEVRILAVTEARFARMEIFRNRRPREAEQPPQQLEFWWRQSMLHLVER